MLTTYYQNINHNKSHGENHETDWLYLLNGGDITLLI